MVAANLSLAFKDGFVDEAGALPEGHAVFTVQ